MVLDGGWGAVEALGGLLRAVYEAGHTAITWAELCRQGEDAVIAAGLGGWDMDPQDAQALVIDWSTRLVVSLALHDHQRGYRWCVHGVGR